MENLLYLVKVKILSSWAGVESIYTDDGEIVVSLREGRKADKDWGGLGIKIGQRQIRLNKKLLNGQWREKLETLLLKIRS
jgi:hypothetical protein